MRGVRPSNNTSSQISPCAFFAKFLREYIVYKYGDCEKFLGGIPFWGIVIITYTPFL
jgi:hypothetical protein